MVLIGVSLKLSSSRVRVGGAVTGDVRLGVVGSVGGPGIVGKVGTTGAMLFCPTETSEMTGDGMCCSIASISSFIS